jgi:hypothetical protein
MVRRKESPKSLSFMMGNSSMFTLPQRNLSFQPNQQQQHYHHHPKLKGTSSFRVMNSTTNANARTSIFSKQKQQQLQRRNHLFKVVGFILYSLGLVSLVLILLMAQRLESGNNRSFRVLLNFVRDILYYTRDDEFDVLPLQLSVEQNDTTSQTLSLSTFYIFLVFCFIIHKPPQQQQ